MLIRQHLPGFRSGDSRVDFINFAELVVVLGVWGLKGEKFGSLVISNSSVQDLKFCKAIGSVRKWTL